MPSAVEVSAYVALVAVGLLAANLTLGLLMAAGFNPARHWPHRSLKLFRLHNWTGYTALTAALIHPAILLFSTSPPFRLIDLIVPVWSPVQPVSNVLGAISLYLVIVVVATSYFRRALGRHLWRTIHYANYAAAVIFFVHGLIADPTVTGRAIDYIDGEKVYVEACATVFAIVTAWRIRHRRARRRAELVRARIRRLALSLRSTNAVDGGTCMPRGDKRHYTDKQKRQADHIEEGYEQRGIPPDEAERRAWATVNKVHHGGEKPGGGGYARSENHEPMRKGGRKAGRGRSR